MGKNLKTEVGTSGAKYAMRKDEEGHLSVWLVSKFGDMELRGVSDADDFEYAVEVEDEELRVLMAEAKEEFGY